MATPSQVSIHPQRISMSPLVGFVTSDSIHVGMTLAHFLTGRHPRIVVGEGKVFLFDPRHCGNSFGLSGEAYARVAKLTGASLAKLPRSTIIDEILVTTASTGLHDDRCN